MIIAIALILATAFTAFVFSFAVGQYTVQRQDMRRHIGRQG